MKRSLSLLLAAVLTLLAACSSPDSGARPELADPPPQVVEVAEPEESASDVRIARATEPLEVLALPDPAAEVLTELAPTTEFGSPRALLVLADEGDFLQVQVPQRPNGLTGWVAAADVEVVTGRHEVIVDLGARTLTLLEDGEVALETPVAIGTPDAPTPTGTFALIDRLQAPDPGGDYGPFALGLAGWSDVFSEFAGGDGQIGIHGTNDPSSIGQAASHGCVRVPNDVVAQLAEVLPLGTPVTIV